MKTPQGHINRYRRIETARLAQAAAPWVLAALIGASAAMLGSAALGTALALPDVIERAEAERGW